jgi:hypothetical protein
MLQAQVEHLSKLFKVTLHHLDHGLLLLIMLDLALQNLNVMGLDLNAGFVDLGLELHLR